MLVLILAMFDIVFQIRYSLPTLMNPEKNWTVDALIMFVLDNFVLGLPLYQLVQAPIVMKHLKGQIIKDTVFEYPMNSQILYTIMYVAMYITGLIVMLVKNLPQDDTFLWIAVVILLVLSSLSSTGILILPFSCLAHMQSVLKLHLVKGNLIRQYSRYS